MTNNLIPDLLDELKSTEAYERNEAIKKIIKYKFYDDQIITALKEVIENDPSMALRNFARAALDVFGVEHSAVEESIGINSKISEVEESTGINSKNSEDNISETNETINSSVNWSPIGLVVGIAPALILTIIVLIGGGILGEAIFITFCLGSLGIPFALIGAYLGRGNYETVWIGTVLGIILGTGLSFFIYASLLQ